VWWTASSWKVDDRLQSKKAGKSRCPSRRRPRKPRRRLRAAPGSSGPGYVRGRSGEDRAQAGAWVARTVASSLDYLEAGISMCRASRDGRMRNESGQDLVLANESQSAGESPRLLPAQPHRGATGRIRHAAPDWFGLAASHSATRPDHPGPPYTMPPPSRKARHGENAV
jgi:hypothetical protein